MNNLATSLISSPFLIHLWLCETTQIPMQSHVRHPSTLKADYMLLPYFLYVSNFFIHVKMFLLILWQLNFIKRLWWKTLQNVFWKSKQTTPARRLLPVCLSTPMDFTTFMWHDCPFRNHADSSPIYNFSAMWLLNFIFRKHSTNLHGKGIRFTHL